MVDDDAVAFVCKTEAHNCDVTYEQIKLRGLLQKALEKHKKTIVLSLDDAGKLIQILGWYH